MSNNEWQPIETAPKEGEVLVLYKWYMNGRYYLDVGEFGGITPNEEIMFLVHDKEVYPTHWIPLPKLPKN